MADDKPPLHFQMRGNPKTGRIEFQFGGEHHSMTLSQYTRFIDYVQMFESSLREAILNNSFIPAKD